MTITIDTMAEHIATGRAAEWTRPLGGDIPLAAHLDNTWYVVLDGTDHYQPASHDLTAVLTRAHTVLALADDAIAHTDTITDASIDT